MFAAHGQMYGPVGVSAERAHAECDCVTLVLTGEGGDKVALDLTDAAALDALGWALLRAAEALGAQPEAGGAA